MASPRLGWIPAGLVRAAALWTGMLFWDLYLTGAPTFAEAAVRLGVYAVFLLALTRWEVRRGWPAPRVVPRSPVWRVVLGLPAWLRAGLGKGLVFWVAMALLALNGGKEPTFGRAALLLFVHLSVWTGTEFLRTRPWRRMRPA